MKLFKKNFLFIAISLIIIIFFNLFFFLNIQSKRLITLEPDDQYHILAKAANHQYCVEKKCYQKNLYSYSKDDLTDEQKYINNRQSHRLILEYHPLYSVLLSKFISISNFNIFKSDLVFRIIISLFASVISILIFKKYFNKSKIILISLIFSTHYNFLPGQHFLLPAGIASIIAFLSFFLIFKNKYLSLIIFFISILIHKIAALIFMISVLSYYSDKILFYSNTIKEKILFTKKLIYQDYKFIFSIFILLTLAYNITFSPFEYEKNIFNSYQIDNIFKSFLDSFFFLSKNLFKTIIFLNPILFYFLLKSLINFDKLRKLKLFIIIYVVVSILFVSGVTSNNVLAERTWSIILICYLIISLDFMFSSEIKSNVDMKLKKIFILTLPIFIFLNLYKNFEKMDLKVKKDNFYYNYENIQKFKKDTLENNDQFIYFDGSETSFYYYYNAGFIQNNFLFKKNFPNENVIKKINYIISDNPIIAANENSDIILNENSYLEFQNNDLPYEIIIFSSKKSSIKINEKKYNITKGENKLKILDSKNRFYNVSNNIRLLGIKLNPNQKTYWPWSTKFEFYYKYGTLNKITYPHLDYETLRKYNFEELSKNVFNNFNNEECKSIILSDIDTSIIKKISCNI